MVRRQTTGTAEVPAGAGRSFRLDPFHLPARVDYRSPARAGEILHSAILTPERVTIRRFAANGSAGSVVVPVNDYSGVLLQVDEDAERQVIALALHHADAWLAVPLFASEAEEDVLADWRAWGRMLARPLLVRTPEGEIVEPYERLGSVIVKRPLARRANRFFAERRPAMLCRRAVGGQVRGPVFREEEIIARDIGD